MRYHEFWATTTMNLTWGISAGPVHHQNRQVLGTKRTCESTHLMSAFGGSAHTASGKVRDRSAKFTIFLGIPALSPFTVAR